MDSFNLDLLLRTQGVELAADQPPSGRLPNRDETLLWMDPRGPLRISRVMANGDYCLRHGDEIAVDVSPGNRLSVWSRADVAQNSIDHFLADQIVPRVLSSGRDLVLHAGAVRRNGVAILLLGASGNGKSTLAASFSHCGWELLGDDAVIVSRPGGIAMASAVYPSLRLLPDSLEAVVSSGTITRPMAGYSSKQRVDVGLAQSPPPDPSPVGALFLIADPGNGEQIRVEPLTSADSCIAVLENSFALDPTDATAAVERMQNAGRLVGSVDAFRIEFPRDYQRLADVREAVEQQVAILHPRQAH